ncbi:MAG: CHAD domain-containing protein [Longimicrobiaceae bacterium]
MEDAAALLDLEAGRAARVLALRFLRDAAAARERFRDPADAAALHDFRVALRRLRSTLKHYRPQLEDGVTRGDRRRVRDLARATGAARDAEVLTELVERWRDSVPAAGAAGTEWMLARLRDRREVAARELNREVAADFAKASRRLEARLGEHRAVVDPDDPRGGPRCAGVVAGRLAVGAEELRAHLDRVRSVADQEEAHEARISAKRLRYLLEPFAAEVEGLPKLVRDLRRLQDLLGDMHDAEVAWGEAAAALEALGASTPDPDPRPGLAALAERAAAERGRRFAELEAAWLGGRAADFFARLRALARRLAGAEPPPPRRWLLRRVPRLDGVEPEWIEEGWLPGGRLSETVRRVRAGGAERWIRTVADGAAVLAEEETPPRVARALWGLTRGRRLRKRRYRVRADGAAWTIDRFGRRGPVVAEAVYTDPEGPQLPPEWLAPHVVREVTGEAELTDEGLAG